MRNPAQPAGPAKSTLAISTVTDVPASLPAHPNHSFKCFLSKCQRHGTWLGLRKEKGISVVHFDFYYDQKTLKVRKYASSWKVWHLFWGSCSDNIDTPTSSETLCLWQLGFSHLKMYVYHLPVLRCTRPVVLLALLLTSEVEDLPESSHHL